MSYQRKLSRLFLPELAIAITLAFLLLVSPAYAEGELPPAEPEPAATESEPAAAEPEPAATETEPAATEPQSAETLPAEEPVPPDPVLLEPAPTVTEATSEDTLLTQEPVLEPDIEILPVADPATEIQAEDPVVVEAQAEDPAVAEVATVLEEEDLSLVNEAGEVLPLASQETAEAISTADPYFTSGGITYRFFAAGGMCGIYPPGTCFDGLAQPITSALTYIQNNATIPTDGKIYVEAGTYGAVTINGSLPNMSTIKGLVGVDGLASTIINGNVSISNTLTGFTLSGFTINGMLIIDTNTGTLNLENLDVNYTAAVNHPIYVYNHKGSINVKQVKSSGNRFSNYFNNTAGTGNITITQSAFDNNNPAAGVTNAHGLYLLTNGTITLDGVSASNNNGSGVRIDLGGALTIKNSVFNNNYATPDATYSGYGVYGYVSKAITISQVIANDNEQDGLYLSTPLTVTLTNVTTIGNDKNGVRIDASNGFGAVKVSYSAFNYNSNNGLLIYAKGPVTLTSVFALLNSFSGVYVENCLWNGSACAGTGTVTVTSLASKGEEFANAFLSNTLNGLYITSKGNILVENFTASGNMGNYALFLDNSDGTGSVTVKATLPDWMNSIDGNTNGNGLYISSDGAVIVDKVHASINGQNGIWITNGLAPTIKPITVSNSTAIGNGQYGINLYSRGLVTLTNVNAHDQTTSGYDGVYIDTTAGTGGVIVKATAGKSNVFSNNDQIGLHISTYGSVAISDIYSFYNGTYGVYVYSTPSIGTPTVSLTRVTADGNVSQTGIYIAAYGPITLTNVTSTNHFNNYGAEIYNNSSGGTPGVTVKNSIFNYNFFDGLFINTKGNVLITTVEASQNMHNGVFVDNCISVGPGCTGVGTITIASLSGSENKFIGNSWIGLSLYSGKNILLTNVRAESNGDHGVYAANNYSGSIGNITVTATSGKFNYASLNGQDGNGEGMSLNSYGIVTVSRLIADFNNGAGLDISNSGALTPKAVTVSDSTFTNNQGNGLYIYSNGLITLRAVESTDNTLSDWNIPISGRTVYDFLSSSHVQDIWRFSGTNGASVNIILESDAFDAYVELRSANGNLILSNDNGFGGTNAQIVTTLPFTGDFYLVATSLSAGANGSYRLTLNDPSHFISTYYYSDYGVYLDNTGGSAGVSILPNASGKGNIFNRNSYYGVQVNTNGAVNLNKVLAEGNGTGGGYLTNNSGPNMPMTFTSVNFNNNDGYGVWFYTAGNVVWKGGGASGNDTVGAYLDGTYGTTMNTVTFSNASFNSNEAIYGGLYIFAKGTITLNSVNAVGNNAFPGYGAYLDNCLWNGSACDGNGNVVISSLTSASFSHNAYRGLYISTSGSVQLTNIAANNNGYTGIDIEANNGIGAVTIQNTALAYNNTISGNGYFGLSVLAKGTITINQLKAFENTSYNLRLITYSAPILAPIKVSNTVANGSLTNNGIFIQSAGAVTLNKVTANYNFLSGAYLESGPGQNMLVTSSRFNGNGAYGLNTASSGKITLNAVAANDNVDYGAYLDNVSGTSDVEVLSTLGENSFSFNDFYGLTIQTNGNVILSKITAQENGLYGVSVYNSGSAGKTVSVNTMITKMNGGHGLSITTAGKTTLASVTSQNNGIGTNSDGLYVSSTSALGLSISNSFFLGNEGSGIEADLAAFAPFTLVNTAYWGNDSDVNGDQDLDVY